MDVLVEVRRRRRRREKNIFIRVYYNFCVTPARSGPREAPIPALAARTETTQRERDRGLYALVSHYRGSPADPLRIPLELEQKLGES